MPAAYRAGSVFTDYYGEVSDYTKKGGVIASIILPPHAPEIYLDGRPSGMLWRTAETSKAQLAYSFDIALQNELTLEENMELRKFVQEQFVTKA
ncbi:MAG: MobA/MobL family protein [Neglectibacter sp.]